MAQTPVRTDPSVHIGEVFADAGVIGYLHARDIATGAEVDAGADDLVVTASVFKIPVLLELCRLAAVGELSLTDRIRIPAEVRTFGQTGLSVMLDDADLSLRDAAYLMMSVSDNHATDVLMDLVGTDRINTGLAKLGLTETVLEYDCFGLFRSMLRDLGLPDDDTEPDLAATLSGADLRATLAGVDLPATLSALDPTRTNRSTPRETTTLLTRIWTADGILDEACEEMRRIMALQVWPHRLMSGFPDDNVRIAAKTGTLPHVRNEAGVVEYPDGGAYAVAVFLRLPGPESRNPVADAAIGKAARVAVDHLRSAP